jgi:hypothetical protein
MDDNDNNFPIADAPGDNAQPTNLDEGAPEINENAIDNNMGGQEMDEQAYNQDGQYGIDPNQQVDDNFLGTNMNQQYGDEMDDGEPVNANGMFGNRGAEDDQQADDDEYFDDAGDIGYLPADHVSYYNF